MDITLNLASPEVRKRRRVYQLAVGGLCLNLLLGLGNALLYHISQSDLRSTEEQLRQQRELVQQKERGLASLPHRLSPKELEHFGSRIGLYNRIIQGANYSFTRLLFELERAIPPNVMLTEIRPDLGGGAVTFLGHAKSMEDLLRCMERLKGQETFHQVYLLNHAEEKGNTGLRFTISLKYRGDAV
jgi:Tfp pilus assembly protein PilN